MKKIFLFFIVIGFISDLFSQDYKPVKVLSKHTGGVMALAFSPDGKTLVSGSEDKALFLWNTSTWEGSKPLTGHTNAINSIWFLPTGSRFFSGGDFFVRAWNSNGEIIDVFKGTTTFIWSIAVKPDSTQCIAGSFEKGIKLIDLKTKKVTTLTAHSKSALAVAYSPDGKIMASGSLDESILLWNAETYKVTDTLKGHGGNIYCVTFSPNGKYIASASNDNTVRLWEVSSGNLIKVFRGHTAGVFSVAFSPDGNYIASGSVDTNVILWEICNGEQLSTFSGHTLAVNEVAFHPSGEYLASASLDKTIAIWGFNHDLLAGHYFANEITKEKDQSGLFQPRSKDESKINYQERQAKAQEFSRQLVEKYYNQYLASIKGIWK